MAKLTVAGIRQQIAALEAKAVRLAEDESKASVAKVRALMNSLGVTIEHLTTSVSKKVRAAKKVVVGKKAEPAKRSGAGVARYRDPATGATWSGFGRAPAWIASVANREEFAVGKASASVAKKAASKKIAAKKSASKRAAAKKAAVPKKVARAVKKASAVAKRAAGVVKRASAKKPAAGTTLAKKATARKPAPRKAAAKKAAASAATSEVSPSQASASN